jgi:hypothetical protein
VDHVLFSCPLLNSFGLFVSEALGWKIYSKSMEDLLLNWTPMKFGLNFQTGLTCFATLAWAIWTTINKMCIQKIFPNKPIDIIFLGLPFIQQ